MIKRVLLLLLVAAVMALLALVPLTSADESYCEATPARFAFVDLTPEFPPGAIVGYFGPPMADAKQCQRDARIQVGGALVLGVAAATWFVMGWRRARPADDRPKQVEHNSS